MTDQLAPRPEDAESPLDEAKTIEYRSLTCLLLYACHDITAAQNAVRLLTQDLRNSGVRTRGYWLALRLRTRRRHESKRPNRKLNPKCCRSVNHWCSRKQRAMPYRCIYFPPTIFKSNILNLFINGLTQEWEIIKPTKYLN